MSHYKTKVVILGVLALITFGGIKPAYAMSQYTCPSGSTLQWQRTSALITSDWSCVDSAGTASNPNSTEVAQCGTGYRQDTSTWGSAICVPDSTQGTSGLSSVATGPTSCDGLWNNIKSPGTCITRALFAGIASFLIWIGVELLTASGLLFEAFLKYTVISFQTPMYASVQDAVNNAWTVFRDISNILIIGFFTFIAISTILGITEYGAKKLLSRVLIVAVLINFSLLFTKLIIDASNFTAYQFYSASVSNIDQPDSADVSAAGTAQVQSKGIAGSFIQYLGVTGFADSYNNIRGAQESNDSAIAGLVIGILAFIFLIATSLVFLYGSFILASRAILFIFLLVTSSLAFATYLIPKLADNYGWSKWWGSLFKNAILAPILMMMLWMTLSVAAGISSTLVVATGKKGTLGALASAPTAPENITALLNFVIILGLLYASFRLASKFSGGIGGFNFAAMVPALGLALGARAVALGGRTAIGRPALAVSGAMEKASRDQNRSLFSRQLYDFGAQRMKGVAKRDFNAMNTPLGGALGAASGLKGDILAGKKIGGALGSMESTAHALAEKARRITPDADAKKAIVRKAADDEIASNASLKMQHEQANIAHETAKGVEAATKEALVALTEKQSQEMAGLKNDLVSAQRAGRATGDIENNINVKMAQHRTDIDRQTQRIKEASEAVKSSEAAIESVVDSAANIAKARGTLPDFDSSKATASQMAYGRLTSGFFTQAENDRIAHLAEHEVGHQEKKKKFKEVADVFKEVMGPEETPAPAAAAAPAHAPAPAPTAPATGGGHADDHGGH